MSKRSVLKRRGRRLPAVSRAGRPPDPTLVDDETAVHSALVAAARKEIDRLAVTKGEDSLASIARLSRIIAMVNPAKLGPVLRGRTVNVSIPGGRVVLSLEDWTTHQVLFSGGWERPLLELTSTLVAT